ncbi:hypothetical protein HZB88_03235 [archaeon]|nr:hypothetical protein [archaeon]
MDVVDKTVKNIKSLKIQGAENIAKAAVKAWDKAKNKAVAERKLVKARPTEPMVRNVLKILFIKRDVKSLLKKLEEDEKKIVKYGAEKIESGNIVYTHCHSSTVVSILKEAKLQGKKFEVHNTETRPFFQGRITATELAKLKIPVTMFVDSAAHNAIRSANLMLLGCDAILSNGNVINKIGSKLMVEVAAKYEIPVYICTHSWKFDPLTLYGIERKIEQRATDEIWKNPPKGVKISNFVFEKIDPNKITAIISELGVLKPEVFIEEVKKNYPWMFG